MSVTHRKDKPDETAAIKEEMQEVKAAGESTVALLSLSFKTQIIQDRAAKTNAITDEMILQSAELIEYDDFKDKHEYSTIGEIFKFDDLYFEVIAKHTSNAVAYPVKTTFAYYRHIELSAAGTIDDPIPYPEGAGIVVNVVAGKYYSYGGEVYLAKADMPNCVYPPNTAGMWQWEKVK
ncbi:hypothetical protein LJC33_07170 [Eubacteriales bacterium OttesenSCG-928-N13]|nr:hypothetical protein [Eubacteriales bacterium OttesenSCG-928-N13]